MLPRNIAERLPAADLRASICLPPASHDSGSVFFRRPHANVNRLGWNAVRNHHKLALA
jgi:hypothetical protein